MIDLKCEGMKLLYNFGCGLNPTEMDTEWGFSVGQCWMPRWCSVTFVLCKDGEGSPAAFQGDSEKSIWLTCGTWDVFWVSQARIWNWGCFPVIWNRQKIYYLAYHMAAVGRQSRSWECWSTDRLVIHMAQMCIYTQDSRFPLGTIFQTGRGAPSCQVVMNRKRGMRHHIFFWSVKSSKPNEV